MSCSAAAQQGGCYTKKYIEFDKMNGQKTGNCRL